jgi:hypothetical protein
MRIPCSSRKPRSPNSKPSSNKFAAVTRNALKRCRRVWLDGLVTAFSDRIHPIDVNVAVRAGRLLPYCQSGRPRHRFHDAVLAATAQVHGHGLLTKRRLRLRRLDAGQSGVPLNEPFCSAGIRTKRRPREVARIRLTGKMAHDDLVCPPPVSARDHPAWMSPTKRCGEGY